MVPLFDVAQPTHPSLIDTAHVTGDLFGFRVLVSGNSAFVAAPAPGTPVISAASSPF